MRFVAGIDGGGTKTKLECRDEHGHMICRKTFGPFNLNSIGEAQFEALLSEITDFLTETGKCIVLCVGAAGICNPQMQDLVSSAMERAGISQWRLVGDHEIALYGALSGAPGCALIAGTGSICCGRNAEGKFARAGGWGHLIDDGGSGYALGRDAAAATVRQWDGRDQETLLSELIAHKLKIQTPQELVTYIHGGDKSRLASLAPLVEEAASIGDEIALQIYQKHGEELGRLVLAVTTQLGMESCETALLGGLLEHDKNLQTALIQYLAENAPSINCISPKQDALSGAVMMAMELIRQPTQLSTEREGFCDR